MVNDIEEDTLCCFYDNEGDELVVGRFDGERYGGNGRVYYATKENGFTYNYCIPVRSDEIKLHEYKNMTWDDIKRRFASTSDTLTIATGSGTITFCESGDVFVTFESSGVKFTQVIAVNRTPSQMFEMIKALRWNNGEDGIMKNV